MDALDVDYALPRRWDAVSLPAPASADAICFQDQAGRTYVAYVTGVFGQTAEVLIRRNSVALGIPLTSVFSGGASLLIGGNASVQASSAAEGFSLTLNAPSFTSGTGTRFVYNTGDTAGSQFSLTITPATCPAGS